MSTRLNAFKATCARDLKAIFEDHSSTKMKRLEAQHIQEMAAVKAELERVEREWRTVQEDLQAAQEDIEDLERELFEVHQSQDRTPSALLFFASLLEEGTIPSIQQVILQLVSFKPLVDGSGQHMDFPTLRKRLQVCVECVPPLQRFISRYNNLHQKWLQERWKTFSNVNHGSLRRGNNNNGNTTLSDIDSQYYNSSGNSICPLCFQDTSRRIQSAYGGGSLTLNGVGSGSGSVSAGSGAILSGTSTVLRPSGSRRRSPVGPRNAVIRYTDDLLDTHSVSSTQSAARSLPLIINHAFTPSQSRRKSTSRR